MSDGSGSLSFDWADGPHIFRLAIAQLRELQDKTGVGPAALFDRLASRQWRVDDLRETIRLGLIGGGMDPLDALVLVKRYVDDRPLMESALPAWRILSAALIGPEDDAPGKEAAPAAATESESNLAASTAAEP